MMSGCKSSKLFVAWCLISTPVHRDSLTCDTQKDPSHRLPRVCKLKSKFLLRISAVMAEKTWSPWNRVLATLCENVKDGLSGQETHP